MWTKDGARGEQIARRLESGYACVNDAKRELLRLRAADGRLEGVRARLTPRAPGIRKYTRQQSILVTRFALKRDVYFFPYSPRVTKLLDRLVKVLYGRGKRD